MSVVPYTTLISAGTPIEDGVSWTITDDWMQGRTTYGGLSAALCLAAVRRHQPDLPPLRSATVAFIGPAGGDVIVRPQERRRGKSVSFYQAELHGAQGVATHCTFAFGAHRESALDTTWTPRPSVPPPDACGMLMPTEIAPRFTQHFDTRLARGASPGSASTEHDHFIWVRHVDRAADDIVALVALADMPPPAVMPMASGFVPVSSMTWLLNILAEAPTTTDRWWLLQTRAEHAANGYSSQDMLIWNADLELVVAGRQSVAIFF